MGEHPPSVLAESLVQLDRTSMQIDERDFFLGCNSFYDIDITLQV